MSRFILALDQGTTSSRAIVFRRDGAVVSVGAAGVPADLSRDPARSSTIRRRSGRRRSTVAREALAKAGLSARDIAAIGVTNQRETTIIWDRATGKPVANAIVWQSRISAPICERLKRAGLEAMFRAKTGLVLDPYFSGTKLTHLLDTIPGLRARAERGDVLFGTVDSFLIWRLTGGRAHVTDVSNASRTLLFNIHTLEWDDELLRAARRAARDAARGAGARASIYGDTDPSLFGHAVPIAGAAGDQQAALFGQACFAPGSAKNTYGTGCFMLLNTGSHAVPSQNGLLTTIAWKIGGEDDIRARGRGLHRGRRGAVGPRRPEGDSELGRSRAAGGDGGGRRRRLPRAGVRRPRRAVLGSCTRAGSSSASPVTPRMGHIARATVDSMAYQTRDVLDLMQSEAGLQLSALQGGRRRRREQRAAAVPGRHPRRARSAARRRRDDRARRGVPCGARRRLLGRPGGRRPATGRSTASSRRRWTRRAGSGCIGAGRKRLLDRSTGKCLGSRTGGQYRMHNCTLHDAVQRSPVVPGL